MIATAAASPQIAAWNRLKSVSNAWMRRPDFDALRCCLATVKALDLDTRPVWLMLLGPSGTGKTAFYLQCCTAYPRCEVSDHTTVAGIVSGSKENYGRGILHRLGKKGLWLFPDFTVILNMREDKRNEIFGLQRRICDGECLRSVDGKVLAWRGRIHSIAACTPAIERYYHAHTDLGQRYLQVRIDKAEPSDDLVRKTVRQNEHWELFQAEILEAARDFLEQPNPARVPDIPFSISRSILDWADFVSLCRQPVQRNYKDEVTGVAGEEGSSRVEQQMQGLLRADAWLMGQDAVGAPQIPLIERLAFDSLPRDRRAILKELRTSEALDAPDVQKISQIRHPFAFFRAVEELKAVGALIAEGEGTLAQIRLRLTDRAASILAK